MKLIELVNYFCDHMFVTVGHLFLRVTNFANGLKRKFEETIFTNLHFSAVCNPCHERISTNFQ